MISILRWLSSSVWNVVALLRKQKGLLAITVVVVASILLLNVQACKAKRQHAADLKQIQELAQKLASSEKTVQIDEGLYAKSVLQVKDLIKVLDYADGRLVSLQKQLTESGDKLAAAEELTLTWKKKYEGAVSAHQTPVPGKDPDGPGPEQPVVRQRVDFTKAWGFIGVSGYTMTDPPEGYVTVEQLRPLKLTVGVAKGTDGQWRAYVKSSEDNVNIDISLAAVDIGVMQQKKTWRDRLWIDTMLSVVGEKGMGIDLSYRFDRYSVGAGCRSADRLSCGVSVGYRPFK